jgi:hypothetical protein
MLTPLCCNDRTRFIGEDDDSGRVADAKTTLLCSNH